MIKKKLYTHCKYVLLVPDSSHWCLPNNEFFSMKRGSLAHWGHVGIKHPFSLMRQHLYYQNIITTPPYFTAHWVYWSAECKPWRYGMKPEYSWETHMVAGRICILHTDSRGHDWSWVTGSVRCWPCYLCHWVVDIEFCFLDSGISGVSISPSILNQTSETTAWLFHYILGWYELYTVLLL